jgi:hypothetical protein
MTGFAVTKVDNDGHMLISKYGNYENGYLLVYICSNVGELEDGAVGEAGEDLSDCDRSIITSCL